MGKKGTGKREQGTGNREKEKVMNILLLVVVLASPVEAPKAGLQEAAVAPAAVASEAVLPTALPSEAGKTTEPIALDDIKVVKESEAQPARILPEPRADSDCNLADLYRRRFLSGPWSVKRRLEAARIRGDTEEIERLTAVLEEIVGEALEVEGTEP